MRGTFLGSGAIAHFLRFLAHYSSRIHTLDLADNDFRGTDQSVTNINTASEPHSGSAVKVFLESPNCQLRVLNLKNCKLRYESLAFISEVTRYERPLIL